MRVLSLFAGIGGFDLGLERAGMRTVAFCEKDEFCRRVLAKHWPDVPQFEDVCTLKGEDVGPVDVICGGYPCQPFSTAGQRRGQEDDRYLWPEFMRLVAELRPSWVIGENVAGHISMGLDDVLSDLAGAGYACRAFVIPACAVDAKHRRDRVWVIGHTNARREPIGAVNAEAQELPEHGAVADPDAAHSQGSSISGRIYAEHSDAGSRSAVARVCSDAFGWGQSGSGQSFNASNQTPGGEGETTKSFDGGFKSKWCPEPGVGRVANGVSGRVDRLKALGNAVVPQIPELIGRAILAAEGRA